MIIHRYIKFIPRYSTLQQGSAQHNINNVNDPVGRPVVHLDHVAPGGLAGDGDEGSAGVLGHGDLLPGARHHGVGAGGQGGGEDEPGL